ncbi:MAG: lysozyme inhibitor LprI family protein [Luteibacter sp.]|uniref:lysozyme inhibitor LprI family protein n=1 Tax=Luteibacter sp. TaxID=1886636 RepID=UPI002806E7AC|nr:lysozyme inhibitor LprI family protein [Luteibacter sp.]MDQ7996275.1 lysozyme inhibitor LprI family protein [Luteibacter sp.]MDQ8049470.1 lysozyme inhibitor LprI family protein [Luteibacter sp.]
MSKTICVGTMLLMPLLSHAAGFDCAKASSATEKAICASPEVSKLDGELGDAFKGVMAAHPEKADALKLDQRHWIASRDEAIAAQLRHTPGTSLPASAARYRDRIDFLKGLDAPVPKPLDVIAAALPKLSGSQYDVLHGLAAKGVPLVVAKSSDMSKPSDFPYEADKTVANALTEGSGDAQYRVLAGSPVSSVYSLQGTANCWSETPFRIEGKKAIAVEAPDAWGADCMSSHELVKIAGDYAAVVVGYGGVDELRVQAARWEGKAFGKDALLVARFDHTLSIKGSACAPKQSPCDDFAATAMTVANRFDRSPLADTLARLPQGADKAAYAAAYAAATADDGMAAKKSQTRPSLPDFGTGFTDGSMADYSAEGTLFPLTFRGETLLGYIDHGHVGWRVNDDWIVSAWRLKAGQLEPVASAYIEVKRGAFLLSSMVPVPAPDPH